MRESFLKRHRAIFAASAAVLTLAILPFVSERCAASKSDVRVRFFAPARGASALISGRDGRRILIDAAPDATALEGLADAMPWWNRKIDVFLVARPDAEQEPVFLSIVRRYHVKEIWWTGYAPVGEPWRRLAADVQASGIPSRAVGAGDRLEFSGGARFEITAPDTFAPGRLLKKSEAADSGIAGKFVCGTDVLAFGPFLARRPDARAGREYACSGGKLTQR